jgi:hypothetical protein
MMPSNLGQITDDLRSRLHSLSVDLEQLGKIAPWQNPDKVYVELALIEGTIGVIRSEMRRHGIVASVRP